MQDLFIFGFFRTHIIFLQARHSLLREFLQIYSSTLLMFYSLLHHRHCPRIAMRFPHRLLEVYRVFQDNFDLHYLVALVCGEATMKRRSLSAEDAY